MRRSKRRRKTQSASRKNVTVSTHLTRLGFESTDEYQQWCSKNGFLRNLQKSVADRQNELLLSMSTSPNWQTHPTGSGQSARAIRRHLDQCGLEDLLVDLSKRYTAPKKFQPLLQGIDLLRGSNFEANLLTYQTLLKTFDAADVRLHLYTRPITSNLAIRCCTFAESIAMVAIQRSYWIRKLEDLTINTTNYQMAFRSLVNHLFVRYPVPEFLINAWFHSHRITSKLNLRTFRHVAAGHSVRTAGINLNYSKRMSHFFMRALQHLTIDQALRWGQVCAMGGSTELANSIVATKLGSRIENESFWLTVVEWFIRYPTVTPELIRPIVEYLDNQRFGVGNFVRHFINSDGRRVQVIDPPAQPGLTMKNRTPEALIREVVRWCDMRSAYGSNTDFVWENSEIESFTRTVDGATWSISELLGNGALIQEGHAMNHCVGAYSDDCVTRNSTIWSMTCNRHGKAERMLTIEVDPALRLICQAKGYANRLPREHEMDLLHAWAREARLRVDCDDR